MNQALIERFFLCLGPDKAQDLRDRILAIINPTFLQTRDEAMAIWDAASFHKQSVVFHR